MILPQKYETPTTTLTRLYNIDKSDNINHLITAWYKP